MSFSFCCIASLLGCIGFFHFFFSFASKGGVFFSLTGGQARRGGRSGAARSCIVPLYGDGFLPFLSFFLFLFLFFNSSLRTAVSLLSIVKVPFPYYLLTRPPSLPLTTFYFSPAFVFYYLGVFWALLLGGDGEGFFIL